VLLNSFGDSHRKYRAVGEGPALRTVQRLDSSDTDIKTPTDGGVIDL
jgi:hypothetical protein